MPADILLDGDSARVEGTLSGERAVFQSLAATFLTTRRKNWLGNIGIYIISDKLRLLKRDETKEWPHLPDDRDGVALALTDTDQLVINEGSGYKGGVAIEGTVDVGNLKSFKVGTTFLIQDKPFLGRPGIYVIADKLRLVRKGETDGFTNMPSDTDGVALAVTDKDKLVINEGGGYKQGVQIEGNVNIDKLTGDAVDLTEKLTVGARPLVVLGGPFSKRIDISNTSIKYVYGKRPAPGGGMEVAIDLIEEIQRLRQQVDFLYTKLNIQKPAPEPLK